MNFDILSSNDRARSLRLHGIVILHSSLRFCKTNNAFREATKWSTFQAVESASCYAYKFLSGKKRNWRKRMLRNLFIQHTIFFFITSYVAFCAEAQTLLFLVRVTKYRDFFFAFILPQVYLFIKDLLTVSRLSRTLSLVVPLTLNIV